MKTKLVERGAALGLLFAVAAAAGATAWSWAGAYADGQRDIAEKRVQLRSLRELAEARAQFARLTRKADPAALILPADTNPQDALSAAIGRAAEGQQVLVDGIDALPSEPTAVSASVHLRGTQAGLYGFLHAIEDGTPYLVVPRVAVELFRAADVEGGKPLILRAELQLAALVAPAVTPRPAGAAAP